MRMFRTAAKSLAGIALVPGLLAAQGDESARNFNDSWFWGVKGGAMVFTAGVNEDLRVTAPSVGAEWLITRTRIALRLSVEQAFFDEQAAVFDPSVSGALRPVAVSDWRRYAAEFYFVPTHWGALRPYAGLGLALTVLQNATPSGTFTSEEAMDSVFSQVDRTTSRASAVMTAGIQAGLGRSALFLQGSAMPTRNNFLLSRANYTFVLEAGVRYNFGSAIEKF
jgi:hypothetical protein